MLIDIAVVEDLKVLALELENDDLFDYVNVRYINRVIPSRFHNTFIKAKLKLMLDSSIVWAMIKECYLCTILIKFIFVRITELQVS